jgi:hypothetical protein
LPLETWWIIVFLLAIAWFAPLLGNSLFLPIERFFYRIASHRSRCVVLIFFITVLLRVLLLPILPVPSPWVHDEFSYLLQGDIFAHGRLAFPPHPMATYLQTFYINFSPTYSSIYPPTQSAILSLGFLLGYPWIGVLLSTAAMVAAVLWMLQGWFPAHWALLGAVFVLARISIFSYWMNSFWGGSVAAVAAALVLGALPRLQRRQRLRDALLLGLGVAILANSRPLEGFILCIPVAGAMLLWLVQLVRAGRTLPARRVLLPIAACLCLTAAFILFYNWRLTGSALLFPRVLYYRQHLSVSPFVWGKIQPALHYTNPQFEGFFNGWLTRQFDGSWTDLKRIELLRAKEFWQFFLGSSLSLLFMGLPWLFGDRKMRFVLVQFLLCACGIAAVTWFYSHYAAPLLCTLTILLVQSTRHLRRWQFRGRPVGVGWTRLICTMVLLQLPACAIQAAHNPRRPCCQNTIQGFERADVIRQLEQTPGQHLVIVRYGLKHNIHNDWVYNSADIDHSRIVWARETPGQDLAPLLSYFSSRKVWLLEPDSNPPGLYPYLPPPFLPPLASQDPRHVVIAP